jgi:hypothetical protein
MQRGGTVYIMANALKTLLYTGVTAAVTHSFVIVGANYRCLGIYMPAATPIIVIIQ